MRAMKENLFYAFLLVSGGLLTICCSLVCRSFITISAFIFTWHFPCVFLCPNLPFLYVQIHSGLRPTLRLHLNHLQKLFQNKKKEEEEEEDKEEEEKEKEEEKEVKEEEEEEE